jgi:ligand-binding sensor domain-containing protein
MRIRHSFQMMMIALMALLLGCSSAQKYSDVKETPTIQNPLQPSSSEGTAVIQLDGETSRSLPNLWTGMKREKISFHPFDYVSDFAYQKDGTLWIVGGFGVLRNPMSGQQTWYSIKNGLPRNFFTTIAVSPTNEVWIGGTENALFRFNGQQWIDEGVKLPPPFDDRSHYVCYSKTISGIDFDEDGTVWVMNNGIEVYAQAHGGWLNFPFPKDLLPFAGGGACPVGIRAKSDKEITIELSPC